MFVADGYGNSRVVKFDRRGKFLTAWGRKGQGGTASSTCRTRCGWTRRAGFTGDRENNRIQVFEQDGTYLRQIEGIARDETEKIKAAIEEQGGKVEIK